MHPKNHTLTPSTSNSSSRFRFFFFVVSTAALALAGSAFSVAGCSPAAEPEPEPGADGPGCDIEQVLTTSCWGIGCHGSNTPAGGLDTESPGVKERVLNVQAKHTDILDGSQVNCGCTPSMPMANPPYTCTPDGALLVDGNNPDNSLILKKVAGTHSCGSKMPVSPRTIDAKGIDCLRKWVFWLADKDPSAPPMGGSGGGGTGGGGSGGGGTGGTSGAATGGGGSGGGGSGGGGTGGGGTGGGGTGGGGVGGTGGTGGGGVGGTGGTGGG